VVGEIHNPLITVPGCKTDRANANHEVSDTFLNSDHDLAARFERGREALGAAGNFTAFLCLISVL
jgi:hypothetical protein